MPDRSDKVERLNEETDQYELPYLSKSRVMEWIKNPEHFRLKYLEGLKEPANEAMVRGSRIHETFEHYYDTALGEGMYAGARPDQGLPEDRQLWADFLEPYVTNFLAWEHARWNEAGRQTKYYLPQAVEQEHWRDPVLGLPEEPEWMGLADAILPAESVPEVSANEGVVIVDFKTGSVPDKKYRDDGIHVELEYYTVLFEELYDVQAAMAYYPKEDRVVIEPPGDEHRELLFEAVEEVVEATAQYEGDMKFEAKAGPLCGWSPDDKSALYGVCSQCTWNVPVDNRNQFEQLVDEGYSDTEIAEHLGCEPGESSYWRYKLDL